MNNGLSNLNDVTKFISYLIAQTVSLRSFGYQRLQKSSLISVSGILEEHILCEMYDR